MNEYIAEDQTPQEFQFLEQLIHYRMGDGGRPTFAFIENWSMPLQKYILSARIKMKTRSFSCSSPLPRTRCRIYSTGRYRKK